MGGRRESEREESEREKGSREENGKEGRIGRYDGSETSHCSVLVQCRVLVYCSTE